MNLCSCDALFVSLLAAWSSVVIVRGSSLGMLEDRLTSVCEALLGVVSWVVGNCVLAATLP